MKKIKPTISNITFIIALIIGGYGVTRTILNYINLPPGVCPVENYRIYMYIALGLSLISIVSEMIVKKKKEVE